MSLTSLSVVAPPANFREPWPDIERIAPDAALDYALNPTWYSSVKVVLDYVLAAALLVPALPIMLLAALAIKLTSPGPAFYRQTRVGFNGRRYTIYKLRTMVHNCELNSGIQWSRKGDRRVTKVGRFLRFTHLDELPQLFNVLMGDMSLVGPRPERPEMIEAMGLKALVPGYSLRLLVKPGVTGLAQLQLPADTDITSVRHKVAYDLYYVRHQSLFLDLRLLAGTFCKAFGMGPKWIRRLFFLPDRDRVAEVFQESLISSKSTIRQLLPL